MMKTHSGGGGREKRRRTNDEDGEKWSDETAARPVVDTGMTQHALKRERARPRHDRQARRRSSTAPNHSACSRATVE